MIQYAVTMKNGEWTVFQDGEPIASGMSRSAAILMAEKLAFAAEERNESVELLVQSYTGEVDRRLSGGE